MLSEAQALPEDPAQLREAAEGLVSLVKSQALRIAKLEHQLAGLRRHRFGSTSESLDQLFHRVDNRIQATVLAARLLAGFMLLPSSDKSMFTCSVHPQRR